MRQSTTSSEPGRSSQSALLDALRPVRVAKYLVICESASLVASVPWEARTAPPQPAPLHEIGARWISKYERQRLEAMSELKKVMTNEEAPPDVMHVTYTPQKVRTALASSFDSQKTFFGPSGEPAAQLRPNTLA